MRTFLLIIACCITLMGTAQPTLLVANKADNTVSVFDIQTKKQLSLIPVGNAPHELAISPDGKTAVVCNYGAGVAGNSLSILHLPTRERIKDISLGIYTRPHGIAFISAAEVIVTSEATKNLIRVNIVTDSVSLVAGTEQAASHMVAWSPTDQMAYVANITPGTVSVISVRENTLLKQFTLKKGIEGIDVSPDGKELWVANREDSSVTVILTGTGEMLTVLPAHQVAYRVKFLPDGKHVLVSNGMSGNMSVYDVVKKKKMNDIDFSSLQSVAQPDKNGAIATTPVPGGITTSKDGKYVFVACAGFKLAVMIETATWKITGHFLTGNVPDGIFYVD